MTYNELKVQFMDFLNRDDCSDNMADIFIRMGLRRVERLLRTPLQEATEYFTVGEDWLGYLPIPTDYIAYSNMKVNGERVVRDRDFYVEDGKFYFTKDLEEGTEIALTYYDEFPKTLDDDSVTGHTLVIGDIVIYSAMVFATDHFVDERKQSIKATLGELVDEVQVMADQEAMAGGLEITSPYEGNC